MSWHAFGLFLMTNFLMSLTPGPAVMMVTGHAAANGWQRTQSSVLGIMAGNMTYCLLAALGLGMLFAQSPQAVLWVKGLGAAYLVYLGVRGLIDAERPLEAAGARPVAPRAVLFRQALLLQLSNPKSVLFFGALLPQFVQARDPAASSQMLVLGACAIALEYPVLTAYSALGAQAGRLAASPVAVHTINVLGAGLLLAAAGQVAST